MDIFVHFFVYNFLGDSVYKKLIFLLILFLPFKVLAYGTNAKSAILMDMDSSRVLYGKDVHYVQSVASISKIMTAIVAIENVDVDKVVTIGDEVLKAYGSGIYVQVGEKIKLEDLLYGLMLRSGNDAALAISVVVSGSTDKFVKLMNEKAKEIGMKNTTFNNPSGLDEEKGNFSSAYDMALLMSYAMKNEEFRKITGTKNHTVKTNKNVYKWHNKNKLLSSYKYTTGGKTGFTKIAKRTLVTSASKDGMNLTVVTINDGDDWDDHRDLYEEAFQEYTSYTILNKGEISILGEDYYNEDTLYLKKSFKYLLRKDEENILKLKFEINKKRKYKTGDKVGVVKVYLGDEIVHEESIYVKKDKKENNFWNKILSWFKHD